jgi:hypothetical protein
MEAAMPLLRTCEHVDWIAEEIAWFDRVDGSMLDLEVPTCPGWDVEALVNHMW